MHDLNLMGRGVVTLGLGDTEESGPPDGGDQGPGPITGPLRLPRERPGGMAASAILHALIVMLAVQAAVVHAPEAPKPAVPVKPQDAVFLPPPAEIRKMLGLRPTPPPPTPPPPPQSGNDRISVGPVGPKRTTDVLEMHRDDDFTKIGTGPGSGAPAPRPAMPQPVPEPPVRTPGASLSDAGRPAPVPLRVGPPGPIQSALRRFEASGISDPAGAVTGGGGQMGPLFFDPQGADFTEWSQRFKNELFRNWMLPPAAMLGWRGGEVTFQFVVDRGGTVTEIALVSSCGIAAYDRAARNAIQASRLLPLPADYAPATLTVTLTFEYLPAHPAPSGRGGR